MGRRDPSPPHTPCVELGGSGAAVPPRPMPGLAGSSALPAPSQFPKGGGKHEGSLAPTVLDASPKGFRVSPLGRQPSSRPLACPAQPSSPSLARDGPQSPVSLPDLLGPSVPAFCAAPQCIPFVGMMLLALHKMLSQVGSGRILRAVCSGECQFLGWGPGAGAGWVFMPPCDLKSNMVGVSPKQGQALLIPNCRHCVEGAGEARDVSVGRMQRCCMEELLGPFLWLLFPCLPLVLKSLPERASMWEGEGRGYSEKFWRGRSG